MSDSYVKHLQQFGYSAIALPDRDFDPLTLVYEWKGRRGVSREFEHLVQNATLPVPQIKPPIDFPELAGKVVRSTDVGGTIGILGGLIKALGGGKLGLSGGFERASAVTFQYGDVSMVEVGEVALERYLRSGQPPAKDSILGRYLSDHLFIATRVLRAREFIISAESSSGNKIELDLPEIANAVGGNLKVERKTETESKISFSGDQDIAIGFQAFWIVLAGQNRMTIRPTKGGSIRTRMVVDGMKSFSPQAFDEEEDDTVEFVPSVLDAPDDGLVFDTESAEPSEDEAREPELA